MRSVGFDSLNRLTGRLRRLPPMVVDAGFGVLFVALVAAEVSRQPAAVDSPALLAVLTLVLGVSLALRRRTPLVALAVGTAALVLSSFLHLVTVLTPLPTLVGAYSVGLYATRARARWGLVIIVGGVVGYFAGTPGLGSADPVDLASTLFIWLAGWAVGYATARRREDQSRARRALERGGTRTDVAGTARRGGPHRQSACRPGRGRAHDLGPEPGADT